MENSIEVPQQNKNRATTYPEIPLSKAKKTRAQKEICTHMLMAALHTEAKTRAQPQCPSGDGCMRKLVYKYNGILFSHKKEWHLVIYLDGHWRHYAKWNTSDTERQIPYDLTDMWNLKEQRTKLRHREQTGGHQRREAGWDEMGECGQKVQTCSYKINKGGGCNVSHGDYG